MLIHQEKKAAFILHPRTASHSIATAFRDIGFIDTGGYHEIDSEWVKIAETVACTVRNPLDVIVSWYFVQHHGRSMKLFLKDWPNQWALNGMFYGLRYCDFVVHYENLDSELNEWLERLGLGPVKLEHENVTKIKLPWERVMSGQSVEVRVCDLAPRTGRFHL